MKKQDPKEGYSAKHLWYKAFEYRDTGVARGIVKLWSVKRLFASPVEVDVLARGDLSSIRVRADRSPDLSLELSGRNIIAEERVVCCCQYSSLQASSQVHLQQ
jgi:hypothetical protein